MTDLSFTRAEKYRPDCTANHIATWSEGGEGRGGGGGPREKGRKREREERKTNINRADCERKQRKEIHYSSIWMVQRLMHWLSVF